MKNIKHISAASLQKHCYWQRRLLLKKKKNITGIMCVSLSIKTRAVFRSIYLNCGTQNAPPCPTSHPVPRGPLQRAAHALSQSPCPTRVTTHDETHLGLLELRSPGKRDTESERERESSHTSLPWLTSPSLRAQMKTPAVVNFLVTGSSSRGVHSLSCWTL